MRDQACAERREAPLEKSRQERIHAQEPRFPINGPEHLASAIEGAEADRLPHTSAIDALASSALDLALKGGAKGPRGPHCLAL